MHHGAVASGTFPEDAALALAPAIEFVFDEGHRFLQQKIGPTPHDWTIDVLVPSEPGEAVREGDHGRRHSARRNQAVGLFGNIFAEVAPVGMSGSTGGEPDKIDEQRQAASVMPIWNVDI